MKTSLTKASDQVSSRLVQVGGKVTYDLGLGHIVGQVVTYFYLSEGESSLDDIAQELGLSKPAVSIAARQLERLGLLKRVWKAGDRKNYYRIVEHLGLALRDGVTALLHGKLMALNMELAQAETLLKESQGSNAGEKMRRLYQRVSRARKACGAVARLLEVPFAKLPIWRGKPD